LRRRRKQRKKAKIFEEEKMKMYLHFANIVHRQDEGRGLDKLKMKTIKKYIRDMENRLHYDLAVVDIFHGYTNDTVQYR
jgi:hypothetical protein